jgi:hypothetical protein
MLLLGAFVGVAAANKITMLTVAGVVLVPAVAAGGGLRASVRRAGLAAAAMVMAFLAVHLASYLGDHHAMARGLKIWKRFVSAPGGEPAFWSDLFGAFLHGYNYDLILPFGVGAFFVGVACLRPAKALSPRALLVAGFCLASIAANLMFVVKRPAGSTLFESTMFISTMSCVVLTMVSHWKPIRYAVGAICAAWLVVATSTFSYQWAYALVADSGARSRVKWDAFTQTLAAADGHPVEVVFPDNSFHHEGVFELLMKGAADFPSWNISKGKPVIDRYAAGMIFRHDYADPKPEAPYRGGRTLVWFDRRDLEPAIVRYPELGKIVSGAGVARRQYSVETKSGGSALTMHVAIVPEGD